MSNRTLVAYEEERHGGEPHWRLEIERSAAGTPGLLFTISYKMHNRQYAHLDREMIVIVKDGNALLAPVMAWLNGLS